VVFIIMLCEGAFPSAAVVRNSRKAEEEERRLFYVALTRARDES
jgi:DNA helicase-2/ATP-dependent DNA helicase PcrA